MRRYSKKFRSSILGFVIGDALGVPVEFISRDELKQNPVKDMIGYGTYNLPEGTWSDDSSMSFCTINTLIEYVNYRSLLPIPDDKFRITILGNIYITQDIDFVIAGFSMFLKSTQTDNIVIQFIGLGKDSEVAKRIKASIDIKHLLITDRLPRAEALEFLKTTSILYYPGWLGYKGVYSGKIFEYLGSKLPILIAPGDKDVLDQLLLKTEAGFSADTPEAMQKILLEWFSLWRSKIKIPIQSNDSINEYTRKHQAHKLANIIKVYL